MRSALVIAIALFVSSEAGAAETDIIKDGCNSLKVAAKRTSCLEALDRLTNPPAPAAPPPQPLRVNLRAMQCERFEFEELNSMKQHELESTVCSYELGSEINQRTVEAAIAKQTNERVKIALMQRQVADLERCGSAMSKAIDVKKRKFPDSKPDCSTIKKKPEPAVAEQVAQ